MAAKKLPIEDKVLKLLGEGLGDKDVAEKVGTTPPQESEKPGSTES